MQETECAVCEETVLFVRHDADAALAVIPEPPAATPAPPEADRACETLERNQRPEIVVLCGVDQRWPVIVARWPDGFTPEAPASEGERDLLQRLYSELHHRVQEDEDDAVDLLFDTAEHLGLDVFTP